ncbi:MAG TPA: hypothetical protein VGV59_04495 [Pyrinomonadaceae bacterium]|nr:hypothetical protein [Pyrinomonadaceae bacterium]
MTERVRGLEEHEASWLMRPVFWASRRMVGKVVTPLKVQARRPGIAWLGNLLGVAIEKSGKVEARVHTLVQLRAAQIVECPF